MLGLKLKKQSSLEYIRLIKLYFDVEEHMFVHHINA